MWNVLQAGNIPLFGKPSCHAIGNFFKISFEVSVQGIFGPGRNHFDYLRVSETKYEQRFSLLLSSSPSPEGSAESVLRESPLVDKLSGSDVNHHTPCVTRRHFVVVCCRVG